MNEAADQKNLWIWPHVGPTPITEGLDSEMFDRSDYRYTETFVREAIQNSLDARLDPDKPVLMKFAFHEEPIAGHREFVEPILRFRSEAGLKYPEEWDQGGIKWLTVEDFNTSGLLGDLDKRSSDYWNYWLNFGQSNKDGKGRGGRGIGRVTFLIASRLKSVIGYTRRHDDGQFAVCGMAVVKAILDEKKDLFRSTHAYLADAVSERGSIYDLHQSEEFRDRVRAAFGFDGYHGEYNSGLGLMIPYPYPDLTVGKILAAAIENFAPAIMNGTLVLDCDGKQLDSESIVELAREVSEEINNDAIAEDVGRYLHLLRLGLGTETRHTMQLDDSTRDGLMAHYASEEVASLQKTLDPGGAPVVVELGFPLEHRKMRQEVTLRAVASPTPAGKRSLDRLFRGGMCLPDVKFTSPSHIDLVLIVNEGLLATYLNLCEGKAHLNLLESQAIKEKLDKEGFSTDYKVKRFVKHLPYFMRQLLTPEVSEPDSHVFDGFFSIKSEGPNRPPPGGEPPPPPPPTPPPNTYSFEIETLSDGLRIKANPEFDDWPINIRVSLAYADGSRKPTWSEYDFRFKDLGVTHENCEIETDKNMLKAINCGPESSIEITGFDDNRELDATIRPFR